MELIGGDYEHTLSIGTTEQDKAAGITYRHGHAGVVLRREPFEMAECSLANYLLFHGNDDPWVSAIPVFPLRAFRHADVAVRKDSKLTQFSQLAGRKVGIKDYSQTFAVWMRGIIKDECGLDWRDVNWVSVDPQRFPNPPEGVKLTTTKVDLEELLLAGEIDALMIEQLKDARKPEAERRLRPLLEDPRAEEVKYFERTGVFPIRHTIAIRKEALARDPQGAKAVFDAYVAAKQAALKRRLGSTFMPWGQQTWNSTMAVFNGDPYPYGLTEGNRKQVALLTHYLLDQGFIRHTLDVEFLFVPGSADWRG